MTDFLLRLEGLIPTIGSFFATLLLFITYYGKQRFDSMKNKLFRYMLLFCLILSITDILAFSVLYFKLNNLIIILTYKIDWFVGLIWYSFFYLYSMCFLKKIDAVNIYDLLKKLKPFTIIFSVICIIYLFIPIVGLDSNNINWLPNYISYYVIFAASIIVFLIIFQTLLYGDITKKNKFILFIMAIELVIFLILQFVFPKISLAPIAMIIQTYFLYFSVENPDLKIIKELEILKDSIEKSSNAKTDFLSNMSHEIRSPMNAIVGFSNEIIESKNYNEKLIKSDIINIYNAGNTLLGIINNILDISKIETGTEELFLKEYSLANIVLELSSIIEAKVSEKNLKFILDVDENIPQKLYGDQTKIYQILLNILTNAAKYTEVGKIKFSVNCEVINNDAKIHFKVSDTGFGIKKEDYNKLFEKFSRLDNAKVNEIEGTGLGLTITKKYVDLMNGKIWFESDYQVGTNFYVDITQKIIDKTPIGDIKEAVETNVVDSKFLDCSKYTILIVDDNNLNIKVAKRIFEKYKFNIDTLDSGIKCINEIKSGKQYDMIFLDHMMPELDGIQTLHIIKKIEDYNNAPIVALTANAITGTKEMYLKEGFDEYISKPINISDLDKLINKYFNK